MTIDKGTNDKGANQRNFVGENYDVVVGGRKGRSFIEGTEGREFG
jgi:hypothetical protein